MKSRLGPGVEVLGTVPLGRKSGSVLRLPDVVKESELWIKGKRETGYDKQEAIEAERKAIVGILLK